MLHRPRRAAHCHRASNDNERNSRKRPGWLSTFGIGKRSVRQTTCTTWWQHRDHRPSPHRNRGHADDGAPCGKSHGHPRQRRGKVWISAVKAMVPERVCKIIDQAIQMHGATGVSQWTPLAGMYQASARCDSPMVPTKSTDGCWTFRTCQLRRSGSTRLANLRGDGPRGLVGVGNGLVELG